MKELVDGLFEKRMNSAVARKIILRQLSNDDYIKLKVYLVNNPPTLSELATYARCLDQHVQGCGPDCISIGPMQIQPYNRVKEFNSLKQLFEYNTELRQSSKTNDAKQESKSAQPKNISGWSGKFIAYLNRSLKGKEPKRGDIRKYADKFLKNYPTCGRRRTTLERAWQRSNIGAQSAR